MLLSPAFFVNIVVLILFDEILFHLHRIAASAAAMVSMTGMIAVYVGKLLNNNMCTISIHLITFC